MLLGADVVLINEFPRISDSIGEPSVVDRSLETDLALGWLEKAFDAHAPGLQYFNVSPLWDNLRDNPRVQILIRRMNLPR